MRKLIVEQLARIARVRELGWDTVVSLRLLGQLEFSLRLLANTRELIRREMPGIKVPSRARLAWPLAPDEIVALSQKQ